MAREPEDDVRYLTVEDVYRIHDEIIKEDEGSTAGVVNEGTSTMLWISFGTVVPDRSPKQSPKRRHTSCV